MSKHSDTRLSKVARSDEEFVKHERSLLESPAWWARSPHLARLLDLLELQHLHNGGKENGRLRLTYGQIAAVGVPRKFIASIIAEGEALGLIVATRGPRESRTKSAMTEYRITYLPTRQDTPEHHFSPTHFDKPGHEWKRVDADKVKVLSAQFRQLRSKASGVKKQIPISRSGQNQYPNGNQPSTRTGTTPAERRGNAEGQIVNLVPVREYPSRIWPSADRETAETARASSDRQTDLEDFLGGQPEQSAPIEQLRAAVREKLAKSPRGTQKRLAAWLGVDHATLSNFTSGKFGINPTAARALRGWIGGNMNLGGTAA